MLYDMTDFVSTGIYRDNCLIEGNHGNQQGLVFANLRKQNDNRPLKVRLNINKKRGISRGVSFESRVFAISIHSSHMKGDLDKTCLS